MADQPTSPLEYQVPEQRRKHGRVVRIIGLFFFAICIAVLALSVFDSGRRDTYYRAAAERARCASNMHQIGLAITLYQNDHASAYPDALNQLLDEGLTSRVFICPGSTDMASTGATTQAISADFQKNGHLSYIYLGKGLSNKNVTDDTVVLYEPMADHGGTGMNMLFGDGHAEWVNASVATKLLSAVAGGSHQVKVNVVSGIVTTAPVTTSP